MSRNIWVLLLIGRRYIPSQDYEHLVTLSADFFRFLDLKGSNTLFPEKSKIYKWNSYLNRYLIPRTRYFNRLASNIDLFGIIFQCTILFCSFKEAKSKIYCCNRLLSLFKGIHILRGVKCMILFILISSN
jgi:hypothetical protein